MSQGRQEAIAKTSIPLAPNCLDRCFMLCLMPLSFQPMAAIASQTRGVSRSDWFLLKAAQKKSAIVELARSLRVAFRFCCRALLNVVIVSSKNTALIVSWRISLTPVNVADERLQMIARLAAINRCVPNICDTVKIRYAQMPHMNAF